VRDEVISNDVIIMDYYSALVEEEFVASLGLQPSPAPTSLVA
jgi:hypothetical protein